MAIKIYNNIEKIGQVYDVIANNLLDYAPTGKFVETPTIAEADFVLMNGAIKAGRLHIAVHNGGITLSNLNEVVPKLSILNNKRRIVWLDAMGPTINRDGDMFSESNSGLTKDDIIISPATVPQHPNVFIHLFHLEKSVFRQYARFTRVKGSVMIINDNLNNELDLVKEVMPAISVLHVTNSGHPSVEAELALKKYMDNVNYEVLQYPKGVAYKASQCEFVLHTYTDLGAEMMGIEAGMTGCQPIYPDTEFYRDIFDGTGVTFYDTEDAVTSLRNIIVAGSTFTPEQVEAFRTKFSAEDNLPAFWNACYKLHSKE